MLIRRAGLYYDFEQYEEALRDYDTLIELFPSNSQYNSHKAQVLEALGRPDDVFAAVLVMFYHSLGFLG